MLTMCHKELDGKKATGLDGVTKAEYEVNLEENIKEKEYEPSIPATGMAVLRQQYVLAEAIQTWINSLNLV